MPKYNVMCTFVEKLNLIIIFHVALMFVSFYLGNRNLYVTNKLVSLGVYWYWLHPPLGGIFMLSPHSIKLLQERRNWKSLWCPPFFFFGGNKFTDICDESASGSCICENFGSRQLLLLFHLHAHTCVSPSSQFPTIWSHCTAHTLNLKSKEDC